MSDRNVDDVTRENARHFVAMTDADLLAQWRHCGCSGCLYCDTVDHSRAMRAMESATQARTKTGPLTTADVRSALDAGAEERRAGERTTKRSPRR